MKQQLRERERERECVCVCVCVWGNLGKLEIRVGCGLVIDSVKDRPWSSSAKLQYGVINNLWLCHKNGNSNNHHNMSKKKSNGRPRHIVTLNYRGGQLHTAKTLIVPNVFNGFWLIFG